VSNSFSTSTGLKWGSLATAGPVLGTQRERAVGSRGLEPFERRRGCLCPFAGRSTCRPEVSTTSIEGRIDVGEKRTLVGRERRRCRLGEVAVAVAVAVGRSSATGWLGGRGSLRWPGLGWTLDAGCWMLDAEHLHACTLELFLASWLPRFPPNLKGHQRPGRSAPSPLPQDVLGASLAQQAAEPWELGLPVHWLISGRAFCRCGHWTRGFVPTRVHHKWPARIPCRSSSADCRQQWEFFGPCSKEVRPLWARRVETGSCCRGSDPPPCPPHPLPEGWCSVDALLCNNNPSDTVLC
jgi:hypothetical protein